MGNWKELGVVPDSDDEGFDSDDFLSPQVRYDPPTQGLESRNNDIWDFPGSPGSLSDPSETTHNVPPEKSGKTLNEPPSTAAQVLSRQSILGQRDVSRRLDLEVDEEVRTKKGSSTQNKLQGGPGVQITATTILPERDEISSSFVEIVAPSANPFPGSSLQQGPTARFFGENYEKNDRSQPLSEPKTTPARQDRPVLSSPRTGRSLRPRKPIQEHPYLLENAQYSHFMKSHGVKPIHIAVQERSLSKVHDKNPSQEQDYTGDDSQPTSSGAPGEESQDLRTDSLRYSLAEEADELALLPSPRTSPPRPQLQASSERSRSQQTDDTSIDGEGIFPDIKDLAAKPAKPSKIPPKRPIPPRHLAPRKRQKGRHEILPRVSSLQARADDDWDIPVSPDHAQVDTILFDSASPSASPQSFSQRSGHSCVMTPLKPLSTGVDFNTSTELVDVTNGLECKADGNATESEDCNSHSDSDIIQRTGKRIKGVLPASWLRLDQQTSKSVHRSVAKRLIPPRAPNERTRGVARVRQTGVTSITNFLNDLSGDDDDEEDSPKPMTEIVGHGLEHGLSFNNEVEGVDDDFSVIEEDYVDWMIPGGKRNRTSKGAPKKRKKGTHQRMFIGEKRYQQSKISKSLHRFNRLLSDAAMTTRPKTNTKPRTSKPRLVSPPALSITDVIEPGAPRFIKVAARAADRRHDRGRSKPGKKAFNLGTRKDNLDVFSVLWDWNMGKIKRKAMQGQPAAGLAQTGQEQERQSLEQLSPNITRYISSTQPPEVATQPTANEFIITSKAAADTGPGDGSTRRKVLRRAQSHNTGSSYLSRPAQLEADAVDGADNAAFTARKKILDLVFRKTSKEILAPTFRLRQYPLDKPDLAKSVGKTDCPEHENLAHEKPKGQRQTLTRPRFRKQVAPKRIDLDAPQFRYANDPLPVYEAVASEESPEASHRGPNKIMGLGPYGTQYTHHFDIFPLQDGVFFHHSTPIGDGTLKKALDFQICPDISRPRPVTSFSLANHCFHWGLWTETTSSELGLLFDMLSEQLLMTKVPDVGLTGSKAVSCADHVVQYLLHSVSVKAESDLKSFTQRLSELLLGFFNLGQSLTPQGQSRSIVDVDARFLICALVLLRICRGVPELSSEALQVEELVTNFSRAIIKRLLEIGTSSVRATYDDLQHLSTRERGIRGDNFILICWVIVAKVLDSAHIPRAGFWDLTYSLMVNSHSLQSSDAQQFENLWRDIFTLVPLEDFDDTGILNKGLRHTAPTQGLQGWGLPQKLLKRVFDLYQSNPKQSPSFNEYCRALLGRCHHLVEQWGWYKCSGIVGTIFDFFGQLKLSNLRNEEVYKSPRFLENLGSNTSLSVDAEDRCFHVFLKILATAIQTLRRWGLHNDIRNLIARTLPNHDRQYSKEQRIYAHDLAALRNHHDLLCTLFWAAPAEDRPAVHLIEKLVSPGSSHKEAVLVNLRAWRQLAQFVVSSGAPADVYRPFMSWQNHVFQQVLDQYLSAAADIQRQYMSMSTEIKKDVGQQILERFISANQNAAKDVLHFCLMSSLEVMRHCPSLASAMHTFNTSQLNKALTNACNEGKDLDCGILLAAFETVELFLERLEKLGEVLKEESNECFSSHDDCQYNDAVELLDEKVIRGFFIAVRQVLSASVPENRSHYAPVSVLREKGVTLSGRIASILVHGEKRSMKHFFSIGKYGLFERLPQDLSLRERTYLPLFVATLLRNHVFDFSSISCGHFDIWILSLVKPFHALKYETYLAETLRMLNLGYMKGAVVMNGVGPDYRTNQDWFACAISYMRQELRQLDPARRKLVRVKYEKLLKCVMHQMRSDIASLALNSKDHYDYIRFIRGIVALIKSHGAEISPVDPFYFQVSAQYKPAEEDPQLHAAGVIAYGLKLGEGEITAGSQLFYYLYNHFKLSMANGRLDAESRILENSMSNDNVLSFAIGRMVPAIIRTSSHTVGIWPMLGVYSKALSDLFSRSSMPREIPGIFVDQVIALLEAILGHLKLRKEESTSEATLSSAQAHLFIQLLDICHAIRPTLTCWLLQPSLDPSKRLQGFVNELNHFGRRATAYLEEVRALGDGELRLRRVVLGQLLSGLGSTTRSSSVSLGTDGQMNSFGQHLLHEVQNNWVVTSSAIKVKVATTSSAQPGTQPAQGVRNDLDAKSGELLLKLDEQLKIWVQEMDVGEGNRHVCWSRQARRRGRCGRRRTILQTV